MKPQATFYIISEILCMKIIESFYDSMKILL